MSVRLAGPPLEPLDLTIDAALDRAPALAEQAERVAHGLLVRGVEGGDRVALVLPNGDEFVAAFFGAILAGAIAAPLNPRLTDLELERLLAKLEPAAILSRSVLVENDYRSRRRRALESGAAGVDEPAVLLPTSGTTGDPKGCVHAHRSLVTNAWVNVGLKRLDEDDRILASVPLFTTFGVVNCILEAVLAGARIVQMERFDAGEALRLIERERVTVFLGTPTMWLRLLEHPDRARTDLSSLRTGTMAGAPAPPDLVERWRALGCDLRLVYGLTEAPSILADGRPTPGIEVEVRDGELYERGYNQMIGYFRDEAATAARIGPDGWLRTGDLAEFAGGEVRVLGRADEMLNVGGFNVQPGEVEAALRAHAGVVDAAAFGIPDRELGEVVGAWVVARAGAEVDPDELRAFCRERLAGYKVPRALRVVRELPLTAGGKVQRFRMREVEVDTRAAAQ